MGLSKAERKRLKQKRKRAKQQARFLVRKALRDKLSTFISKCEVIGCDRHWTDMHHMVNPGRGIKDDSYENMMGLCHEHHMQIENTPNWSKVRWAATYFWGSTYADVADFVAMCRRLEEAGAGCRSCDIGVIPLSDVPSDGGAFRVMLAYAERDIFEEFMLTKDQLAGDGK